jgi:hypothetical protein
MYAEERRKLIIKKYTSPADSTLCNIRLIKFDMEVMRWI